MYSIFKHNFFNSEIDLNKFKTKATYRNFVVYEENNSTKKMFILL